MTPMTHIRSKIAADTLAARLILLRHEMGWSQRVAAEQTGVSYRTWQGMEDEHRETRSLDRHISAIATVSGYDRDWLMWGGPLDPHHTPGSSRLTRQYLDPRLALVA